MGYQSTLYALVHGSDLIPFMEALDQTELTEYFTEIEPLNEDSFTKFEASGLKWYDGYEDVESINQIFNNSMHSVLLRIGEDKDDEEYYTKREDPYELFEIEHTVTVTF